MKKKYVGNFQLIENTQLNTTNYLLKLKSETPLPEILPGQFVNVEIPNTSEVFLRRPFSIFEVDYGKNTLSMIIKILGKGSKKLTESKVGSSINLVYPLGKSFTLPQKDEKILLIGGGSGVAPMLFLSKKSKLPAKNIEIIIGARTKEDHFDIERYNQYATLNYTSEDGSYGEKGFVVHHSKFQDLSKYDKIYACGPLGMMKAVDQAAKKNNIFCEVSLENLMACGFGVCLCCIEPTKDGNKCVCTEGPVFNVNELKW